MRNRGWGWTKEELMSLVLPPTTGCRHEYGPAIKEGRVFSNYPCLRCGMIVTMKKDQLERARKYQLEKELGG